MIPEASPPLPSPADVTTASTTNPTPPQLLLLLPPLPLTIDPAVSSVNPTSIPTPSPSKSQNFSISRLLE
ncbi:Protein CBG26265 [Caenorhabditis briggsae]|uniref:Uncharacterized protein n=2 Tax=Caenorhabditis briggsae TaxID=6238 RepID=A0AAE9D3F1_CAEBR|nr:Protein CBG26265 [Caenorhabditis briggsae]ULT93615.1 hypothetical protein L3Y34_003247 [Caenorhabditis briggsae]CAS00571.1 Protein CBG26265 [Caenorhabditis briggsae]